MLKCIMFFHVLNLKSLDRVRLNGFLAMHKICIIMNIRVNLYMKMNNDAFLTKVKKFAR